MNEGRGCELPGLRERHNGLGGGVLKVQHHLQLHGAAALVFLLGETDIVEDRRPTIKGLQGFCPPMPTETTGKEQMAPCAEGEGEV